MVEAVDLPNKVVDLVDLVDLDLLWWDPEQLGEAVEAVDLPWNPNRARRRRSS